jgi:phosphonatase-like hydrolase
MEIKLFVFDLAGTTIHDNDDVNFVLRYTLEKEGIKVSRKEVNDVMGYPKPVAIKMLFEMKGKKFNGADQDYLISVYQKFSRSMITHYRENPEVREKTGVTETFRFLRGNNIKIGLDTGFSREITDAIFSRLGWEAGRHFDVSVTSDEVPNGRPHPDMIFRCMKQTGVTDAGHVAKVGDTVSDLLQGKAAGCGLIIGVTTGACSAQELKNFPHHHLIKELPEIINLI